MTRLMALLAASLPAVALAQGPDRSRAPEPGPASALTLPQVQRAAVKRRVGASR